MNKGVISILLLSIVAISCALGFNYFTLSKPLQEVIESDYRNKGIDISVHYDNYINPKIMVFDVKNIDISAISAADVFRVFWSYSNKLKDKEFDKVILSSKGQGKYYILGSHFKIMGREYGIQNPVYIVRTFPENVYTMGNNKAFGTWTGGLLGVTNKQMEDFNKMSRVWFIDDALK